MGRRSMNPRLRGLQGSPAARPATGGAYSGSTGVDTRGSRPTAGVSLPEADELAARILNEVGHLVESDFPAVRDYAVAQLRAWRLAEYLENNGDFDGSGRPRPALELLRRWLERAEKARSRIGLDPMSRAALDVDRTLVADRVREWLETDLSEGKRLRQEADHRRMNDSSSTEPA